MAATVDLDALLVSDPNDVAVEAARLNDRLAHHSAIPAEIAEGVYRITAGIADQSSSERWEAIDPYLGLIVHRAALQAEEALRGRDDPAARDQLRVGLETLRQAFAAIAENEMIADDRPPKEIARWLSETAGVPQSRLAELLGVSLRQFQRWISSREPSGPEADDARRLRAVARIVNQLRFSLTPTGAVDWFTWPRDDLEGRRPIELLDEPERLPGLVGIASSMRSTYLG